MGWGPQAERADVGGPLAVDRSGRYTEMNQTPLVELVAKLYHELTCREQTQDVSSLIPLGIYL